MDVAKGNDIQRCVSVDSSAENLYTSMTITLVAQDLKGYFATEKISGRN